jgi:hypothetical protein
VHDEGGHGQLVALPPLPYRIMATDNRRHLPAVNVGEFALDNLTGIDRGGTCGLVAERGGDLSMTGVFSVGGEASGIR